MRRNVHNTLVKSLISLILAGSLTISQAGGPAIGFAVAKGSFQIDGASVSGNATLFGGATIETGEASSRLQFSNGARIELAPQSRAKIFSDHLTLEKGLGELAAKKYRIEARSLRVETSEPKSLARVSLAGSREVLVTALNGPVRVYNEIGLLVANVKPGVAMSFQPQAGAATSSERTGCLMRSKVEPAKFILVDEVADITVEVRGDGLAEQIGNRIKIKGSAFRSEVPVAGASQVIQVDKDSIELITKDACATGPVGPKAADVAKKAGISNGAKVAIAVAVVGGAAGGIVAATAGSKSR
jgi:hypothetical protein